VALCARLASHPVLGGCILYMVIWGNSSLASSSQLLRQWVVVKLRCRTHSHGSARRGISRKQDCPTAARYWEQCTGSAGPAEVDHGARGKLCWKRGNNKGRWSAGWGDGARSGSVWSSLHDFLTKPYYSQLELSGLARGDSKIRTPTEEAGWVLLGRLAVGRSNVIEVMGARPASYSMASTSGVLCRMCAAQSWSGLVRVPCADFINLANKGVGSYPTKSETADKRSQLAGS